MKKTRIGVLMGGKSIEKEVSFNSGRTVCDHLDTSRYDVVPIFHTADGKLFLLPWAFLYRGKTTDFIQRLAQEAEQIIWDNLHEHVDFIYIAEHGRYGEDGKLQGMLEILKVPYFGSKVFASAVGMNKQFQKKLLTQHGIHVPRDVHPHDKDCTFPLVVKPNEEGSSLGTRVVDTPDELPAALEAAAHVQPDITQPVVVEERITGMEFTCIVIIDYTTGEPLPLPPTEIIPEAGTKLFDYDQKYMPGRATKFTPARCTKEQMALIQDTCIDVMRILEFTTIARIDGFLTKDNNVIIIDANSLAGMAPSSFVFRQAAEVGMNHAAFINHLIETELHAYGMLEEQV